MQRPGRSGSRSSLRREHAAGVDGASISPSRHHAADGHWHGEWDFKTLVASAPIGVDLPKRVDPGPVAARIAFFAPVGLLFFFVVAILGVATEQEIHPLNFFFLGCSFFAFHLLFAYLVDHVALAPSFAIASLVSVGLSVSYARLFTGWRFALRELGLSQLIYLVLFSFSFFWTGFTGLAITVGAIVTLFVMMQITGRTSWKRIDARRTACPAPYRCAEPPA
jgi:inner membrane protein involved in colicin E2 resistance